MVAVRKPVPVSIVWVRQSEDFYRSEGSRFDLWLTRLGYWIAVDADRGKVCRDEDSDVCEIWCEEQLARG